MKGKEITGLTVEGYKSFGKKQYLQIRPLTLLAGTNSSGKTSVIQPLLLLKQTLEASFDPGPLKIDGPNVAFSWNAQMFTKGQDGETVPDLNIGLEYLYVDNIPWETTQLTVELKFQRSLNGAIVLAQESIFETIAKNSQEIAKKIDFTEGNTTLSSIHNYTWLNSSLESLIKQQQEQAGVVDVVSRIVRNRCFLDLVVTSREFENWDIDPFGGLWNISLNQQLGPLITNIVYIPGLRDPASARSYPLMPVAERFPGPMHSYLASIIYHWGQESALLGTLEQDLRTLGLAEKVSVEMVNDTALEVLVSRRLPSSKHVPPDLVSLADVGLGLSQVMPVLAALRIAQPHHLVVMEQPELHLHPRGVHKLAEVIVEAVNRGVRIIMETHSELLLLGIQTMVAQGHLDPTKVSLNWFSLDEDGHSLIHQAGIEQDGSFGDWPVDFLDVEWAAQRQYLDAVSSHA
ncbi:MAG: AAA family ATPase [Caldilineaceae bacterium]|nr:AAA family ATPase [Caldilineaceae bacterium]